MPKTISFSALAIAYLLAMTPAYAQEADASAEDTGQTETADDAAEDVLFSDEELQQLVAPVALYPDTLLIQILVGATVPIDVVKADRLLLQNEETSQEELEEEIKAQGYDPSVEVLAIGFPTIINRMAENIEWTETVGNAMLAQSDDVMDAVQIMRDQAIETGALIDSEEQVVSRDETSDAVIIQPADPEVVYVPQYDPNVVYAQDNTGDILTAGLITFGTILIISEIFDDDDDWNDYWGCRNCGGWGGQPIYRNPNIDIDVDGNVNIGNSIDIDKDNDRFDDIGPDGGWKPSDDRKDKAQDRITERKEKPGATTLGMKNSDGKRDTDAMRDGLSERTGARDISAGAAGAAVAGGAIAGGKARTSSNKTKGIKERSAGSKKVNKPKTSVKPRAKPKSSGARKPTKHAAKAKPKVSKNRSGKSAKAASHRGGSSAKKANRKKKR